MRAVVLWILQLASLWGHEGHRSPISLKEEDSKKKGQKDKEEKKRRKTQGQKQRIEGKKKLKNRQKRSINEDRISVYALARMLLMKPLKVLREKIIKNKKKRERDRREREWNIEKKLERKKGQTKERENQTLSETIRTNKRQRNEGKHKVKEKNI